MDKGFPAAVEGIINQCDRCGACLAVCPLYAVSQREITSARGKIATARALLEGGLTAGPAIARAFEFCLLCGACTGKCPSRIETGEVMVAARRYTAGKLGRHRLIAGLLGSNFLLRLAAFFLKAGRETSVFPSPRKDGKVAYFRGCAMKLFYPAVAGATLDLLQKTAGVAVPQAVCCGSPHWARGMVDQALALARRNIERFAAAGLIVTDCASCGRCLKEYGARLAGDPRWAERAREFSQKVMDLSEYLSQAGYRPPGRLPIRVTYHEPCHLGRGQGITRQPRELLRLAADYVELPSADRCCGGAGTFYLDFPREAARILDDKVADIVRTGAGVVATGCPACLMQLAKGEQGFKVMHIAQVLAGAMPEMSGGR